jgi:hypothetical protein
MFVDAHKAASSGLLPGNIKIIAFGQAQGADFRCPRAQAGGHTRMLDWLDDYLPAQEA